MFKAIDVTYFSLSEPFPSKEFETLPEAFEYAADQIENCGSNRFEIQDMDDDNLMRNIEIDARSYEG